MSGGSGGGSWSGGGGGYGQTSSKLILEVRPASGGMKDILYQMIDEGLKTGRLTIKAA